MMKLTVLVSQLELLNTIYLHTSCLFDKHASGVANCQDKIDAMVLHVMIAAMCMYLIHAIKLVLRMEFLLLMAIIHVVSKRVLFFYRTYTYNSVYNYCDFSIPLIMCMDPFLHPFISCYMPLSWQFGWEWWCKLFYIGDRCRKRIQCRHNSYCYVQWWIPRRKFIYYLWDRWKLVIKCNKLWRWVQLSGNFKMGFCHHIIHIPCIYYLKYHYNNMILPIQT